MKKAIMILIAFFILALILVLVATMVAVDGNVPVINENIQLLQIGTGKQFIAQLKSNPTTGFTWDASYDKSALELVTSTFIPSSNSKLLGAGGVDSFTFKTLKPSETKLIFSYRRPWESKQPQEVKDYTIKVLEAGAEN